MDVDMLLERPPARLPSTDRIRTNTPSQVNQKIDQATMKRVWEFAGKSPEVISERIGELDREWDLERTFEMNAAGFALTGVFLSATVGRRWLVVPACVLSLLLQHTVTRKSIPMQVLRRMGFRTRREIEAEKYALRLLRGDFDTLKTVSEETHKAIEALRLTRV